MEECFKGDSPTLIRLRAVGLKVSAVFFMHWGRKGILPKNLLL